MRSCGEGHFVGEIEAREEPANCDGNALHYNGEVGLERAGAVDSAGKNDEARRTSAQNKHLMRSIKKAALRYHYASLSLLLVHTCQGITQFPGFLPPPLYSRDFARGFQFHLVLDGALKS